MAAQDLNLGSLSEGPSKEQETTRNSGSFDQGIELTLHTVPSNDFRIIENPARQVQVNQLTPDNVCSTKALPAQLVK